jgi:nuclear receptor co-repressor 1
MTIGGPKGSITHGTPVNSAGQPMGMGNNGPATLSPRYDTILRQTPPSGDKIGSITQGTPVHLPTHHLPEKRLYEMYKTKGGSPHQPQQGSSPQNLTPQQQQQQQQQQQGSPQSFSSPYGRPAVYQLDPQPQLSSRQIIMNDYITSQQMHGRSGPAGGSGAGGPPPGRSDKETPSPHNSGGQGGHPVTYYDPNSERARVDFMARKSQAERISRRPSPHRTPPPQRQGVIHANPGRHSTTASSKLPSPATSAPTSRQLHMVQPHHYQPAGLDAFSSLVDVAVQQPLLPVPHKDDNKPQRSQPPVSVTITEPPSPGGGQPPSPHHHDIRYHLPSREQQISMQIQQQRQHQMVSGRRKEPPPAFLEIF